MITLHKIKDKISEWWRYPQPSFLQKALIGLYTDVVDIDFTARRLASEESAKYVLSHMRTAPNFKTDYDFHEWAVTQVNPELLARGLILEFGVATGRTLNHFGKCFPLKTIYGFDGFDGLPEDWTSDFQAGHFGRQAFPTVRKNCELVVGWFDSTLPTFIQQHTEPIAFLHIDCDLYSSTVTVLSLLKSQIVPGTIIIFDEYFNYPGWNLDEFKAWQEFVAANGRTYEYIGYVGRHQKVAVRVTK